MYLIKDSEGVDTCKLQHYMGKVIETGEAVTVWAICKIVGIEELWWMCQWSVVVCNNEC